MNEMIPHFVVPKQRFLHRWAEALVIVMRGGSTTPSKTTRLSSVLIPLDARPSSRAVLISSLCHILFVLLLIRFPLGPFSSAPTRGDWTISAYEQPIYYDLRAARVEKTLPTITSPGAGGKPGQGADPAQTPSRGGAAFHPRLTIVMNPPRPDNNHQTIIQPASPPDLKIARDVNLPNILIGSMPVPPKPRVPLNLSPPAAPMRTTEDAAPPLVRDSTNANNVALAALSALTPDPKLPVPILSMPAPKTSPSGANGNGVTTVNLPDVSGRGSLLAIGIAPGELNSLIAVPPGNRYGSFSVSPAGTQPGSPGGMVGGNPHGGLGAGPGTGDGSPAEGSGSDGGGGANIRTGSPALNVVGGARSFSGAATSGAKDYALPDAVAAEQVFPVLIPPHLRGLNLQVFTGPAGGGGLGIYHVLPCNKIYTTMLSMPGKSWVLQYCTPEAGNTGLPTPAGSRVLSLGEGLVPPDPTEKFDFKRPVLPADSNGKLIVLRGAIPEDGSVTQVTVLSSIDPVADALAAAAFRHWKFHPALRSGKPIRIEILVGIPAASPGKPEAATERRPETTAPENRSDSDFNHAPAPRPSEDHLRPSKTRIDAPVLPRASAVTVPSSHSAGDEKASSLQNPLIPRGAIMLQVAALQRESEARALAQVLQQNQFPTLVLTPATDKFYRVQVGPYADAQSAATARHELQAKGFNPIIKQ
jgi:cell division septation protein DedD